jgi:hypothetical protein
MGLAARTAFDEEQACFPYTASCLPYIMLGLAARTAFDEEQACFTYTGSCLPYIVLGLTQCTSSWGLHRAGAYIVLGLTLCWGLHRAGAYIVHQQLAYTVLGLAAHTGCG